MTVLEIELDDEVAQQLIHEASSLELSDRETYVCWLLEHRAIVHDGSDLRDDRIEAMDDRIASLEANESAVSGEETNQIQQEIDKQHQELQTADDEEVSEAVATVDDTLRDDVEF